CSQTDPSQISTYFFKTIMLWACEAKHEHYWIENSLMHIVQELLFEVIHCVQVKTCPNYFMPSNNIMDALEDMHIKQDIDALWHLYFSCDQMTEVLKLCAVEDDASRK